MTKDGADGCVAPLFVPADRPDRFEKAYSSGADALILDLEDAVAPARKAFARTNLSQTASGMPIIIRINGLGSAWYADDLVALPETGIAGIMLPKAEVGPEWISFCRRFSGRIPLIALVETAQGVAYAREIAATPGVTRLAFGSVDYCADLGCADTPEALSWARTEIVLASRLAGLAAPLDGVTTRFSEGQSCAPDAVRASELGFGGKLCIHPRQIAEVLEAFRPSDILVAWARRLLAAGEGAIALDGMMIDEPVRLKAKAVLLKASRFR